MSAGTRVATILLDGQEVAAREDETLLEVARQNRIDIPTMCHFDGLSEHAGCRLCLVEVRGTGRLVPACVTTPSEGMEVITRSERLDRYRRMIVEMLFSEGNHICSICVANGNCELQALAARLGVTHVRLPGRYPRRSVDASHPLFTFDPNRCILCTRCVRVCDEIEGAHTWDVAGRGSTTHLITDLDQPWGQSETCTSCGKCVQVCPTGALSGKGLGVGEMPPRRSFLPYLTMMRGTRR